MRAVAAVCAPIAAPMAAQDIAEGEQVNCDIMATTGGTAIVTGLCRTAGKS